MKTRQPLIHVTPCSLTLRSPPSELFTHYYFLNEPTALIFLPPLRAEPVGGALALRAPVTRRTTLDPQSTRPAAPVAPRTNNPGQREATSKQRAHKGENRVIWDYCKSRPREGLFACVRKPECVRKRGENPRVGLLNCLTSTGALCCQGVGLFIDLYLGGPCRIQ